MFASRAITSTQSGHRFATSAKFTSTRQVDNDIEGKQSRVCLLPFDLCVRLERLRTAEIEDETHPNRSLACALVSALFCPILGK
jgi:hypothetical protein